MPRRSATVTQADLARTIRACQAAKLPIARVIISEGCKVVIEMGPGTNPSIVEVEPRKEVIL